MLQREKEAEHFKTWEEQEDNFHLQQAKLRCCAGTRERGRGVPTTTLRPPTFTHQPAPGPKHMGPVSAPGPLHLLFMLSTTCCPSCTPLTLWVSAFHLFLMLDLLLGCPRLPQWAKYKGDPSAPAPCGGTTQAE